MQQSKNIILRTLVLSILVTIMASCSATKSNIGKTALMKERIAFGDEATNVGKWETNDLFVNYTIKSPGEAFSISGTIKIKYNVLNSFPLAEYFNFSINFLDSSGTVLSTHDISPLIRYRAEVPDQLKFGNDLAKPAEAVSFNFSYFGIFKSNVGQDTGQEDWEILYKPFEKKP